MDEETVLKPGQFNNEPALEEGVAVANETDTFQDNEVRTTGSVANAEPTALTSGDLQDVKDIKFVQPETSTASVGLQGQIEETLNQEEKRRERDAAEAQQQSDKSLEDITSFLRDTPGETELTARAQTEAGIPEIQKELDDIDQKLRVEQNALRRQIERIQTGASTATKAQRQIATDEVERQSLRKQADLSIIRLGIQGRFDSAQAIAKQKVDVQMERDEREFAALTMTYNNNKDLFTKKEQRAFEASQAKMANDIATKRETLTTINNLALTAGQNGAPQAVMSAILGSDTQEGAIQAARAYLVDPIDRAIKNINYNKANIEYQELLTRQDVMKDETWGDLIADVGTLVGVEKGKETKANLADSIKDGNFGRAYTIVANNVEEKLTGDVKTKFANARNDINVMIGLRGAIQQFSDAGGDLGLLTGKADEISNRLLGVTGSPELTSLAVQLDRRFQAYRSQISGAAFTPEESRDYAKVNPRTTATLDLNLAIIDGAINDLENQVTSTVNTRVSGAQKLWDLSTGQSTNDYINSIDAAVQSETGDSLDDFIKGLSDGNMFN